MPVVPEHFNPLNKAKDKFHDWPIYPYPTDTVRREIELRNGKIMPAIPRKIVVELKNGSLRKDSLARRILTFCQTTARPVSLSEIRRMFPDDSDNNLANRLHFLVKRGYLEQPMVRFYKVAHDGRNK